VWTLAAHGRGIELAISGRDFEERGILRAFFDVGEFRGHAASGLALDGEVQLLIDPKSFFLAILARGFPLVAGPAIDGLRPYFFTGDVLASGAGIAVQIPQVGHALHHGALGVSGKLHVHLCLGHQHIGHFAVAIHDHAHFAAKGAALALARVRDVYAHLGKRHEKFAFHINVAGGRSC